MPTPSQLLAAAKATGFPVVEMSGWRGRCRCHSGSHERAVGYTGRRFGPWHGITIHQTAGPRLTGQRAVEYVRNILIGGNGHVPGPLSQYGIGGDGTIYMIAAGRSNHIGRISQAGLTAMRSALFSLSGNHNLRGSGVDGNVHTIGFELLMNGSTLRDTATDPQRTSAVRLAAELSRIAGWSGRETHGHGEVSIDRSFTDPGYDMGRFRRDVMARVSRNTVRSWFDMATLRDLETAVERVIARRTPSIVHAILSRAYKAYRRDPETGERPSETVSHTLYATRRDVQALGERLARIETALTNLTKGA